MNGVSSKPMFWFYRRPGWTVAMLVILQGALIWLLDSRWPLPTRPRLPSTAFHLLAGTGADERLAARWTTEDPTLFALVSAHGFSGPVWLNYPRVDHRLADWVEPPQWLAPRVDHLGVVFGEVSKIQTVLLPVTDEKPMPPLAQLNVSSTPVARQSTVSVEGALSARPLAGKFELPAWSFSEILTNSEVQVMVGEDGRTFSAVLLVSCGLKTADETAIEWARKARFKPGSSPALDGGAGPETFTWGRLLFQWVNQDASATNGPSGKAKP
jgi:hypothetical protein